MRFVSCLYVLLASPLLALEPSGSAIQEAAPLLPQGTLNAGIETAGSTTDGQFSVMLPLHSSLGESGVLSGTLVFAEPFATWIERGATDLGLGLGVRHLFGGQPTSALNQAPHVAGFLEEGWYVGAHLYGDLLQTSNDVRYWQLTPGVEIGTRYLELRAHYQIPLTDGETTHVFNAVSTRTSTNTYLGTDHLLGHRTTTFSRRADVLHESLQGWDLETAALVPWVDQYMDLKLVGGYASYHSTSLDAIKYDSWKAGVELRPFPACVLSAMYYTNQRLVGDHWMYGLRLELPFETANIGDGKGGFWGHIKSAFQPRRRHLAERLSESAHAHQLEPQIAIYTTKETVRVRSRFSGALILPDGTVLSVHDRSSFSTSQSASSLSGSAVFAQDSTYAGVVLTTYNPGNTAGTPPDSGTPGSGTVTTGGSGVVTQGGGSGGITTGTQPP